MTSAHRRPLIAGNWKMHNTVAQSVALARAVADGSRIGPRTDVVIAPVFTALAAVAEALRGTRIGLAGQDVFWEDQGAFTGEVAAPMLRDVGCSHIIVGHSERRMLGDTDEQVHRKLLATQRNGLTPIACLGESLGQRQSGATHAIVGNQLDNIVGELDETSLANVIIAYEPIWAIGTGHTAQPDDAQRVHAFLRDRIRHRRGDAVASVMRILYGGSVKPENAAELLAQPDIDGALVGGASLDAAGFTRIIHAAG